MSLKYDIELVDFLALHEPKIEEEARAELFEMGMEQHAGKKWAAFRHQETVDALKSADERVQNFFFEAGFIDHAFSQGYPDGTYPLNDILRRLEIVSNLFENLKIRHDLKKVNWGGLDPYLMIKSWAEAQPVAAQHEEMPETKG